MADDLGLEIRMSGLDGLRTATRIRGVCLEFCQAGGFHDGAAHHLR